ncbi:hypothetical protein [Caldifermentibacillus hisashii]
MTTRSNLVTIFAQKTRFFDEESRRTVSGKISGLSPPCIITAKAA